MEKIVKTDKRFRQVSRSRIKATMDVIGKMISTLLMGDKIDYKMRAQMRSELRKIHTEYLSVYQALGGRAMQPLPKELD